MFTYLSITIVFVIGMFLCLPKTRIPTNLSPNYRLTVIHSFCKRGTSVDDTEEKCESVHAPPEEEASTFMVFYYSRCISKFFLINQCLVLRGRKISPRVAVTKLSVFNRRFESIVCAWFIDNSWRFRIKFTNYFYFQ